MKTTHRMIVLLCVVVLGSCKNTYQPQQLYYEEYRIDSLDKKDTAFIYFLKPYADSINKTMNKVLAEVQDTLGLKRPSGSLGNILADALLEITKRKTGLQIDAAFVNYGGVRINFVGKGPLTLGKVYEIMPFDNLVIVQRMKGSVLKIFLDHVALSGGWPSAGITMTIRNKKATDVLIAGKPLDADAIYTIVNSDYIVNGGDNTPMLRDLPKENTNYYLRSAFADYFEMMGKAGKKIVADANNRISYAN